MGKANKAGAGSDKKLAKKLAHEQALQRQARIRAAYAAGDPFTTLKPFASFQRNGLDGAPFSRTFLSFLFLSRPRDQGHNHHVCPPILERAMCAAGGERE